MYPLTSNTRGKDKKKTNKPGILRNIRFAPGPFGKPRTAVKFLGKKNSYIQLPNDGGLDAKNAITILAWVKPEGRSGPIVNYHPNAWSVLIWIERGRSVLVRYTRRNNRKPFITLRAMLKPRKWNNVGTSYDRSTGKVSLFVNERLVKQATSRERPALSTQYPVRMGARMGRQIRFRRPYFKGLVSCLQFYNVALKLKQVRAKYDECFRKRRKFVYVACFSCVSFWFYQNCYSRLFGKLSKLQRRLQCFFVSCCVHGRG